MQKTWTWIRNSGLAITAVTGIGVLLITVGNVLFLNPIHHRLNDLGMHIDQRFDDQDKSINQRFDAQDKYMNTRFDAVDQRFDGQDQRIDDLEAGMNRRFDQLTSEVAELRKLTVSIGERVSRNEGQIDVILQQLQTADAPAPLD